MPANASFFCFWLFHPPSLPPSANCSGFLSGFNFSGFVHVISFSVAAHCPYLTKLFFLCAFLPVQKFSEVLDLPPPTISANSSQQTLPFDLNASSILEVPPPLPPRPHKPREGDSGPPVPRGTGPTLLQIVQAQTLVQTPPVFCRTLTHWPPAQPRRQIHLLILSTGGCRR